ncbi:hypothetical protein BH09BAC1_BH09BAC1_09890 [soil metagenome]
MKNLFSIKTLTTACLAFVLAFSFASCETDNCKDIECTAGGDLSDNGTTCTCVCKTGYSGSTCSTLVRASFIGNYNGTETCGTDTDTYAVKLTAGTTDVDVQFENIYDAGFFVNGTVNSQGGITIPSQSFGTGTISGNATVTANSLSITFTVSGGGNSATCTFVGSK